MTYFSRLPKIKITEIEFEFGEQLKNAKVHGKKRCKRTA